MRQHSSELEGMTRQLDCLDGNCVRELWNQQRAGRLHWCGLVHGGPGGSERPARGAGKRRLEDL